MSPFQGRWALVTGASSGLGRACANALAAEGAALLLAGRSKERLDVVADEVREAGASGVSTFAGDLAEDAAIEALTEAVGKLSRLDILIHSAGSFSLGSVETTPVAELDKQIRVNLRAPYALTRNLLPTLRASAGQVVFFNSSVGKTARGGLIPYAASKHGLRALADGLREEVNANGIRVLSVFLGRTATPMQEHVCALEDVPYRPEQLIQPSDVAVIVLAALSLPRTVEVTDLHLRPMQKS